MCKNGPDFWAVFICLFWDRVLLII
ncbi:putative membrane protein, partial [Vibrio parahaemolyticus V-223/04]